MEGAFRKVPLWMGALIGALFTPALMAVMFLGERLATLPFVPFDVFDWLVQVLPAEIINFGKELMVDLLLLAGFNQNLDTTAKTAERLMGMGIFWIMGVVLVIAFVFIRNRTQHRSVRTGDVLAIAFGLPMIVISQFVNISSAASELVQGLWLAALFWGFGRMVAWAYDQLSRPSIEAVGSEKIDVEGIDRRRFLIRAGGATAALTVIGAGLGELLNMEFQEQPDFDTAAAPTRDPSVLPNADAAVQPAPGTRPEVTPVRDHYRIDILSGGLPSIPEDYTLPITGLVANEVEWTLDDLREMPSMTEYITMSCISNRIGGSLISTTKWTGVSFQHILEQIDPTEEARALKITGADNFDEYVDLDLIRNDERIMLTYAWDDEPLPLRNGFPLRIHIPDRYGMKQPKWIRTIEVVDEHEEGYWVRRGWSAEAIVNTVSVVDTVAVNSTYEDEDGQMRVPVGGMAWAGDRGIARVEVRVDGGEWVEADLRDPLSQRSWVLWRYDWPFAEGNHTFEVRCYEMPGEGESDPILQPTETRGTRPDGATGIHSRNATVRAPEPEGSDEA